MAGSGRTAVSAARLYGAISAILPFLWFCSDDRISALAVLAATGWDWVILRGVLLMGSTVLNFFAVRYIPLTLTSTILFSAPILVCTFSWPLLGERVGLWRWGAIMLGFVGILIAIRPFDDSFHWAAMLSLGAAFCFAFYSILTRKLSGVVAIDTMQFYSGFVGTLILAPFAIAEWQSPAGAFGWIVMILMGVLGWLGHQLLTQAHGFATRQCAHAVRLFLHSVSDDMELPGVRSCARPLDCRRCDGGGDVRIDHLVARTPAARRKQTEMQDLEFPDLDEHIKGASGA